MVALLKLIRWKNLVIILLTEVIIKYVLMDYFLREVGLSYRFNNFIFVVVALSSIAIAAAGYIINDIKDIAIDRTNRPYRPLVNGKISLNRAFFLFYLFNSIGIVLSIFSALLIGKIALFSFQFIIIILLFSYSTQLKCKELWGNIVVSFTTAMVPLLIWLYTIYDIHNYGIMFNYPLRWMHFSVWFFILFAFLTNFIRELIKDREDRAADARQECVTWAGSSNLRSFKRLLSILIVITIISIGLFQYLFPAHLIFKIFLFLVQGILVLVLLPKVVFLKDSSALNGLSTLVKVAMIFGVISPVFLWLN